MTKSATQAGRPADFSDQANRALRAVQSAFADALASHQPKITGSGLSKSLRIDGKLAWRVVRLARAQELISVAEHLPGDEGVRIFLRAAQKHGISAALLSRIEIATAKYRELVEHLAGDRPTLDAMLASTSSSSDQGQRVALQQRRDLFQAASRAWGIRCRTQFGASFVHPTSRSDRPGYEDFAIVRGFVDLVRLRPNLAWPLPRGRVTDERLKSLEPSWYPIDARANTRHNAPLLSQFCSEPLPSMQSKSVDGSTIIDKFLIADWPIGVRSPVTIVLAECIDAVVKCWNEDPSHQGEAYLRNYTPSESLLLDHFVHRKMLGKLNPEAIVLDDLGPWPPYPLQAELRSRTPIAVNIQHLGPGIDCAHGSDVPNYREMLQAACDFRRWNPDDFDCYRLRIEYPPVPSIISMKYPMPSKPPAADGSRRP